MLTKLLETDEMSEKQIAEFIEISKSAYSLEVIASLERSSEESTQRNLVTAYISKDYEFLLRETQGDLANEELKLLRARVFMDLNRYEEAYAIMKSINREATLQKDV